MQWSREFTQAISAPYNRAEYAIIADCRETKILPFLKSAHTQQLVCADFQVWRRIDDEIRPVIIIERKTWKDLASSIIDKRMDTQLARMVQMRKDTGVLIYYLIEGAVFQPSDREMPRSHLKFSSLIKRLDHTCDSHQIQVKHSRDYADTARRIVELVKNYSSNREPVHTYTPVLPIPNENTPIPSGGGVTGNIQTPATTNTAIPSKYWTSVSGISSRIADALCSKYTLADILARNVSPEDIIATVRGCTYRCGTKTASKILAPDCVRFLISIAGISKPRAVAIAEKWPDCLVCIARGNTDILVEINAFAGTDAEPLKRNSTIGKKISDAIGAPSI